MGVLDRAEQYAQHTQLQHHMPTVPVKVHTVDFCRALHSNALGLLREPCDVLDMKDAVCLGLQDHDSAGAVIITESFA